MMDKNEAEILRMHIINNYKASPRMHEFTTTLGKFGVTSIDDWALSVEEIIQFDCDKPELYFMVQIEKLAKLIGCSDMDAQSLAVRLLSDIDAI